MEPLLRRGPAEVHIQSRECDRQILGRFTGASFFPERLLGWAVISAVGRGGGALLYVTAPPVLDPDEQIDYYLGLLGPGHGGARSRVRLVGVDDLGPRWLSEKVLDPDNPQAAEVREAIREFLEGHRRGGDDVRLDYFEPSAPLERFARELGVPGNQPDSSCIPLGTKHSGRRLFAEAGIPVPAGSDELCRSIADIAVEVARLARSGHRTVMIKLDDAASGAGLGNALLDLDDLGLSAGKNGADGTSDDESPAERVLAALPRATLVDPTTTWDDYVRTVEKTGAVVEEWIRDDTLCSPSFQGRITDAGAVEAVSTHDQVLGGHGQSYTGCRFPASAEYRHTLLDYGLRIGRALREQGVGQGDYGVDFLARRTGGNWQLLGCEINLRGTGTRHAFGIAAAVLGTRATPDGRLLVAGPGSAERVYECSDSLIDPRYAGLRPARLIRAVTGSPLGYDPKRATGVVLHMLSAVTYHGKFGAVCIGADRAETAALMRGLRELVDDLVDPAHCVAAPDRWDGTPLPGEAARSVPAKRT
ncbi:peptide ligase PGM1-related protein [Streptomyces sp. SP17BM10]|uniref:peptide ligase PGM1-related protein n=1 Tax=Streptomyces sp. SP17BM10 TaxID=3002530 RepID=UPI002E75DEE0|nr:peptide ligase PGM1-related protein [Streptomyces sp. SP17BM10]MEE1783754.1 peptide ligase PGM1-related protein [Streptomyces sp. SP17BM10]